MLEIWNQVSNDFKTQILSSAEGNCIFKPDIIWHDRCMLIRTSEKERKCVFSVISAAWFSGWQWRSVSQFGPDPNIPTTIGWTALTFCTDMVPRGLWWSPDFSFMATMRLTLVVQSEIKKKLLKLLNSLVFATNIHVPERIKSKDFGDTLTLHLAQPAAQKSNLPIFCIITKYLQN